MAIKGGWAYQTGAGSGTISVPNGARVVQISAKGDEGATINIDGLGAFSASPSYTEVPPLGNMVGPFDIDYVAVDSIVVSWVA